MKKPCFTYKIMTYLKAHIHLQSLLVKMLATAIDNRQMMYLPWPSWAARQNIEMIVSLSCSQRLPRQVQSCVSIAGVIVLNLANGNTALQWVKTVTLSNVAKGVAKFQRRATEVFPKNFAIINEHLIFYF
jgi:hypothetical protein